MAALTNFQLECERRLSAFLSSAGTRLEQRVLAGEVEPYVTGRIAGTDLTVWIYEDGAEFCGEGIDCRFEAPDFDTEAELIESFLRKLEEKLKAESTPRDRAHASPAGAWRLSLRRFLSLNPALAYGLIGALLLIIILVEDIHYDDRGIHGLIFWMSKIFILPYRVIHELLFGLSDGRLFPGFDVIALIGGIALCVAFDVVYRKALAQHRKDTASKQ